MLNWGFVDWKRFEKNNEKEIEREIKDLEKERAKIEERNPDWYEGLSNWVNLDYKIQILKRQMEQLSY